MPRNTAPRVMSPSRHITATVRKKMARISDLVSQLPAARQLAFWDDLVGDGEVDWRADDSSGRPTERKRKLKDRIA